MKDVAYITLVVDVRERALIESLKKTVDEMSRDPKVDSPMMRFEVEVRQLDIGDVEIWERVAPPPTPLEDDCKEKTKENEVDETTTIVDNAEIAEGGTDAQAQAQIQEQAQAQAVQVDRRLLLMLERKTVTDLAASIVDGRYAEQRHRMLSVAGPDRVAYVIEKGPYIVHRIFQEKPLDDPMLARVRGALTNLLMVHRLPVAFTSSVDDTVAFLIRAATALVKGGGGGGGEKEGYSGAACRASIVKAKKGDNVDPRQCFLQQLCQIPGVSHRIASNILDKTTGSEGASNPSISALVRRLDALPGRDERLAFLREIPLVGKKVSERILEFIG